MIVTKETLVYQKGKQLYILHPSGKHSLELIKYSNRICYTDPNKFPIEIDLEEILKDEIIIPDVFFVGKTPDIHRSDVSVFDLIFAPFKNDSSEIPNRLKKRVAKVYVERQNCDLLSELFHLVDESQKTDPNVNHYDFVYEKNMKDPDKIPDIFKPKIAQICAHYAKDTNMELFISIINNTSDSKCIRIKNLVDFCFYKKIFNEQNFRSEVNKLFDSSSLEEPNLDEIDSKLLAIIANK